MGATSVAEEGTKAIGGKAPGRRRVRSLDGLRAMCALGVIGYHMRLPWLGGGLLGVTVLFVLSGYLVTAGILREFDRHGSFHLGPFLRRRLWRIMPTAVLVALVAGIACAMLDGRLFEKFVPDLAPALGMVLNWTKIFANESYFAAAGNPSPLTHYWSLAIEAQFYLVWPPVLALLLRRGASRKVVRRGVLALALVSAALMALLYVPGADPSRVYYGTDTRAFSLLLGCWLAFVWPFDRVSQGASALSTRARKAVPWAALACVVGIAAMMVLTVGYTAFPYYGGLLLCSLLSVGAIAALAPGEGIPARIMSAPPLAWLGSRSYAIYLWHFPLLELANPLNSTTGVPWWQLLAELACVLVLSEASYRLVEMPCIALGRPRLTTVATRRSRVLPAVPALAAIGSAAVVLAACLVVEPPAMVRLTEERIAAAAEAGEADKPLVEGERHVMHAALRKPLRDGVYDVVLIGDSVSLGANQQLNAAFPHGMIDTRGCREPDEALDVLEGYLSQGVVGDDVVISIGTNGVLTHEAMDRFLADAGPERRLWFVNMRSPNAKDVDNNALVDEYVAANANVSLVDWHAATEGHDDWLSEDGIHLTWEGRDAYTALVVGTMGYELPDEDNTTYDVVVLGDAMCVGAVDGLAQAWPGGIVDVAEGRTVAGVANALREYDSQGVVGPKVVLCVGSEERIDADDLAGLLDAVGDRQAWILTIRSGHDRDQESNRAIERAAAGRPNVSVIDWNAVSKGRDEWLSEDGMPNGEGARVLAELVRAKVDGAVGEAPAETGSGFQAAAPAETPAGTAEDPSSAAPAEQPVDSPVAQVEQPVPSEVQAVAAPVEGFLRGDGSSGRRVSGAYAMRAGHALLIA